MGFLWPSKLSAEPNVLTRFGRVCHWLGAGLAGLLAGGAVLALCLSIYQAITKEGYWSSYPPTVYASWPNSLGFGLALLVAATILFLLSRALRYIFSGE